MSGGSCKFTQFGGNSSKYLIEMWKDLMHDVILDKM